MKTDAVQITHQNGGPATLTILPTYRCTAACEQCCFGSNPHIRERLEREEILNAIRTAHQSFSSLQQVVFSGGECTMIGEDLFDAIQTAHDLGLGTRIVTNGFWGASKNKSAKTAQRLSESGLKEINISTGRDHAKFVSIDAVLNAMTDAVNRGIFGFLTIEQDAEDSAVIQQITSDARFDALKALGSTRFRFQINTWMKFNDEHKERKIALTSKVNSPCTQLFGNIVVTPHKNISACCGLTYEHIPEMRIGTLETNGLQGAYEAQKQDFMKIWIHVDGADGVINKVYDGNPPPGLISSDHMCDTCARMHKCDKTRELIRERFEEFLPEVMFRYELNNMLNRPSHTK